MTFVGGNSHSRLVEETVGAVSEPHTRHGRSDREYAKPNLQEHVINII